MVSKSFPVEIAKICRYRFILTIWVAFGKGMNVGQAMVRAWSGANSFIVCPPFAKSVGRKALPIRLFVGCG
jgi:hypothetical protein